ncbi:hypothetical protein IMCC3317_41730 [Kordia antarctica]|uniref:Uncharacterized protein n=1 Tax=Kordia antarctica TaxID=1218801 RepID=A0A7L4ZPV5_9FLAO|nr:hypothetical protein [Kordia antarctica]QHI38773.1 hypothetical protein IMCC3317_41730 [Kordia antarctica]
MKKYILVFALLFALQSYAQKNITIFELEPSQSMIITGKGAGQDAAVNPYKDGNSIAIVKNLGKNIFTIRIEYQGKITRTRVLEADKATMIPLRQGSELYLDSDLKAKAKIDFKKGNN